MANYPAPVFRAGINLWPPFLFTGIHVTHLSRNFDSARVELRMRPWNRNYVGTHFGGSLFAMTDPFWMLLLMHRLGRDYYVWDQKGEIDFLKPGKGTVSVAFDVPDSMLDAIRADAASGEKLLKWFENDIVDKDGTVVAKVRKQVYIRLKPDKRPPSSATVTNE